MSEHPQHPQHSGGTGGWFDRPENVNRFLRVFYVLCALVLFGELLFHKHAVHPLEDWFGFYPIYGFAGIVLLVLLAKLLRKLVMRPEDYYDA